MMTRRRPGLFMFYQKVIIIIIKGHMWANFVVFSIHKYKKHVQNIRTAKHIFSH